MHPIERLRYVARADGAEPALLVREAAAALAGFGADGAGLVTACRRLLDRHVTAGPLWSLAARVLTATEPVAEAWRVADEVDADETPRHLAAELPDEGSVLVVGWPELVTEALRRRGDLEVLVVSSGGEAQGLARRLNAAGVDALDVPDSGLGRAVTEADVVVLEAQALGPEALVAAAGSLPAAAVAAHAGIPVWVAAGAARVLPPRLWQALAGRLEGGVDEPWHRPAELVPLVLVDLVFGPEGPQAPGAVHSTCPVPPELLKPAG